MILLWILVGLGVNALIGCGVWAAIDDEDQHYFEWYKQAPNAWLKTLVLELWPVGLFWHVMYK